MKFRQVVPIRTYDDFIVMGGCPRSGTTFAQLLLHETGLVDTANETHLLSQIVGPCIRRYRTFALQRMDGRRNVGPHVIIGKERFEATVRPMVDQMIEEMRRRGRNAPFTCEKTPENIMFWPEIAELLPGVRFVEVVRDPRAVFSSTKAAASKWAGSWATMPAGQFARRWVQFIRAGSALAGSRLPSVRVHFEKLVSSEPDYLQSVLAAAGMTISQDAAAAAREATRIRVVKQTPSGEAPWMLGEEPTGFFRRGEVDSWKQELNAEEVQEIEAEAGAEMAALGYRLNGGKLAKEAEAAKQE